MLDPFKTIDATPEAHAAFLKQTQTKLADKHQQETRESKLLHVIGLYDFIAMELPIRETIMAPWLMTQSLNMIHGWRGVGKTQSALVLVTR
jgi:hypothetical protein